MTTGGGPPCTIQLSEVQTDAINQISTIAISGHKKCHESIVGMTLEDKPGQSNGKKNLKIPFI